MSRDRVKFLIVIDGKTYEVQWAKFSFRPNFIGAGLSVTAQISSDMFHKIVKAIYPK